MAVSFNVPKSPKRNISASDTFMGVDLTNTAVDMDGFRSPNAENMVRHVPGKVRKRMGYYKDILFGTKTNVNFAKDTSAKEKEIVITTSTASTWVKVYDTIQELSVGTSTPLYLEFDYKSQDTFNIINSSIEVTASEDWEHISTTVYFSEDDTITEINIFSDEAQEIYIKNFAIMLERGQTYTWSPAPNYFVERESNDPVYGCHFLRRQGGSYEGDRITNVNRALQTSDEFESFTLPSETYVKAYDLGETPPEGTTITIDFDYEITSGNDINVYFEQSYIRNLSTGSGHFTYTKDIVVNTARVRPPEIGFQSESAATIQVKNVTLTYSKNRHYAWSPAPEDNGEVFHIEDMCVLGSHDYANKKTDTQEINFNIGHRVSFNLLAPEEEFTGKAYVSFDITTSVTSGANVSKVTVEVGSYMLEFNNNITEPYHIECYVDNSSAPYLAVRWTSTSYSSSVKGTATYSNMVVKKYDVRKRFTYSAKSYLYHVGKDFYLNDADTDIFDKVYEDANEHISRSFQLLNKCYIIDGKHIYQYSIDGGETVEVIGQDNAYIPIVTEAKEPTGGGSAQDALNMLQPGFIETFYGKSSVTEFQLSFSGLDDTECKAWTLNSSGDWIIKYENSDFTVNRTTGKVTFTTAPGITPIDGEPNVKIQAYRTVPDYADRVNKCTVGALFGVAGACDRIFLSGNEDHPNWDFYSQRNDPTYFPDIAYSVLGSEQSKIMGYAIVNNYLTTFKDGFDQSQSVFVREGDMLKTGEEGKETSEPVFKLINTLQGEGVLAPYTFGYLQTEPLFLTKAGVYAITEQDITGEKYTQNRSFYLDGKLRKEPNLESAIATVYDNQYILAVNNQLYVLDGLQATRTDKSEPYATRQYAGFLCKDIPASCIWTDDTVCFGTTDGKVCRFYTDEEALASYNDDGKPIYCCWETPDLDGQLFYKNKTFRYFAVRLMKAIKTSVRLYSKKLGIWTLNDDEAWTFIKEQTAIANALNFESVDFDMFTFSVDTSEKVVHTKLRVKKVDKARFRVENDALNEPFGISDIALEYIESGNYKG